MTTEPETTRQRCGKSRAIARLGLRPPSEPRARDYAQHFNTVIVGIRALPRTDRLAMSNRGWRHV